MFVLVHGKKIEREGPAVLGRMTCDYCGAFGLCANFEGRIWSHLYGVSVHADSPLLYFLRECPSCQQALLRTETLQRRAGAQNRYPCQTLLLGLQAEVVMVQLAVARGEKAFETLRESEQLCSGL